MRSQLSKGLFPNTSLVLRGIYKAKHTNWDWGRRQDIWSSVVIIIPYWHLHFHLVSSCIDHANNSDNLLILLLRPLQALSSSSALALPLLKGKENIQLFFCGTLGGKQGMGHIHSHFYSALTSCWEQGNFMRCVTSLSSMGREAQIPSYLIFLGFYVSPHCIPTQGTPSPVALLLPL